MDEEDSHRDPVVTADADTFAQPASASKLQNGGTRATRDA
jgi:hypothetical protein